MKHITLSSELLAEMNVNYSYQMQSEFEETLPEVEEEVLEISDEDISEAFVRIERNELKEELIALEAKEELTELKNILDSNDSNDEEIIKEVIETSLALDTQSNNNQIPQANESDDFDWF